MQTNKLKLVDFVDQQARQDVLNSRRELRNENAESQSDWFRTMPVERGFSVVMERYAKLAFAEDDDQDDEFVTPRPTRYAYIEVGRLLAEIRESLRFSPFPRCTFGVTSGGDIHIYWGNDTCKVQVTVAAAKGRASYANIIPKVGDCVIEQAVSGTSIAHLLEKYICRGSLACVRMPLSTAQFGATTLQTRTLGG